MEKKSVTPKHLNDLIGVILADKILECEKKQIDAINQSQLELNIAMQGAIDTLTELAEQVDLATSELQNLKS